MKYSKICLGVIIFLFLFLSNADAIGNEEYFNATINLEAAKNSIKEMEQLNISTKRVNEIFEEANQLYLAKIEFEKRGKKVDYELVNKYAKQIIEIKDLSLSIRDELEVFKEEYEQTRKETNLSQFSDEYDKILATFDEERFEETQELIEEGYNKISEIQSQQTKTRVFYVSSKNIIKNFLTKNWQKMVISCLFVAILLIFFQKKIEIYLLKNKLKELEFRKEILKKLIKSAQKEYFQSKKISHLEYSTKIKEYGILIREIERQKMIMKEQLYKENCIF